MNFPLIQQDYLQKKIKIHSESFLFCFNVYVYICLHIYILCTIIYKSWHLKKSIQSLRNQILKIWSWKTLKYRKPVGNINRRLFKTHHFYDLKSLSSLINLKTTNERNTIPDLLALFCVLINWDQSNFANQVYKARNVSKEVYIP